MFIYDLWDEWLYGSMLKRSWDMRRSRNDAAPKVGGDDVADQILMGAFMGLHKRELTLDPDPPEGHLPSEVARTMLEQAFNSPMWNEVRLACRGKQALAAVASASILDTITRTVEAINKDKLDKLGKGKRARNTGEIASLDKVSKADDQQTRAEHEQELLDVMEQMHDQAKTQREKNSIEAAMRKTQAKRDMHDKEAQKAEAQGREAMEEIATEVGKQIGNAMYAAKRQIESMHQSMEKLVEAGVLDDGEDEFIADDLDAMGDPDEAYDEEERAEIIRDIVRGAGLKASQKRELEGLSADALRRIRASGDALKASASLVRLAQEIGRIKNVFRSAMKPVPIPGNPGGVEGVTYGNKISSLTSAGLATLAAPRLRKIWRMNFVEENLPEREMWGPDTAGRGPIVLALDCSSSMTGTKFFWGKALALALVSIAKEQERDFAFIGFDDKLVTKLIVPQGKADMSSLIAVEETPCNGNTRYRVWMEEAVKIIESKGAFAKADVVVITDGEPGEERLDPEEAEQRIAERARRYAHSVRMSYVSQEQADHDLAEYARDINLWGWWNEQRERLGFRVRGIFIRTHSEGSACSRATIERAEYEIEQQRAATMTPYVRERIEACEQIISLIEAEIAAGYEISAPITTAMIEAASAWHYAEAKRIEGIDPAFTSKEYRLARQHTRRADTLRGMQSAAGVMSLCCDTWADVSQVADPVATAAVEAEIARMVQ